MSDRTPNSSDFLWSVYNCSICPQSCGFEHAPSGSYFKFPPLIGKNTDADLLFVGINPRRTDTNLHLHSTLMSSKTAFGDLAANRWAGAPYIHADGSEHHYRFHLQVVEGIYGEGQSFENVAAVTELFFCASANSDALPFPESPCANRFMPKTLQLAQPKVIIAVGGKVMSFFMSKPHREFGPDGLLVQMWEKEYRVVAMPHPANPNILEEEKRAMVEGIIPTIKSWLDD